MIRPHNRIILLILATAFVAACAPAPPPPTAVPLTPAPSGAAATPATPTAMLPPEASPGRRDRARIGPMAEDKAITATLSLPADNGSFNGGRSEGVKASYAHVSTSNTIRDIVDHPAFQGFGQFILPLELGYDENMPLTRVGSLLPYHSNVNPDAVVNAINTMIDDENDGQTIFYDYYTDAQKMKAPDKASTGLFFFRGNPGAPFAVVCPGGGFAYVGSVHEGFPHAIALSQKGYNAFVLQYRVGGERIASEDLAAALSYIFENAATLEVSTKDYSLWGSSAGARMVARIGSYGTAAYGGEALPRPSTVVMAYTGHTDFTEKDPPTFVVVGDRDGIASASTMERRVDALRSAGVDVEFHIYRNVGHGFGLGIGTNAGGWLDDAARFWESHIGRSRK